MLTQVSALASSPTRMITPSSSTLLSSGEVTKPVEAIRGGNNWKIFSHHVTSGVNRGKLTPSKSDISLEAGKFSEAVNQATQAVMTLTATFCHEIVIRLCIHKVN